MVNINVCIGSACHIKGSHKILATLKNEVETRNLQERVELAAVFCMGHCTEAVSVKINEDIIFSVSPETAADFFEKEVMSRI